MEVSSWWGWELVKSEKLSNESSLRMKCSRFWASKVEGMAKNAIERPMKGWKDDCKGETPRKLIRYWVDNKLIISNNFKIQNGR